MKYQFILAVLSALVSFASAQAGPNTLARYNPANRTMSANTSTYSSEHGLESGY